MPAIVGPDGSTQVLSDQRYRYPLLTVAAWADRDTYRAAAVALSAEGNTLGFPPPNYMAGSGRRRRWLQARHSAKNQGG
jgi:hypothetical protein